MRCSLSSRREQGIKIENDTDKSESTSYTDEQQEGQRLFPEQADDLDDDSEDQKHTGYAQGSFDMDSFHRYCPGVQNFAFD